MFSESEINQKLKLLEEKAQDFDSHLIDGKTFTEFLEKTYSDADLVRIIYAKMHEIKEKMNKVNAGSGDQAFPYDSPLFTILEHDDLEDYWQGRIAEYDNAELKKVVEAARNSKHNNKPNDLSFFRIFIGVKAWVIHEESREANKFFIMLWYDNFSEFVDPWDKCLRVTMLEDSLQKKITDFRCDDINTIDPEEKVIKNLLERGYPLSALAKGTPYQQKALLTFFDGISEKAKDYMSGAEIDPKVAQWLVATNGKYNIAPKQKELLVRTALNYSGSDCLAPFRALRVLMREIDDLQYSEVTILLMRRIIWQLLAAYDEPVRNNMEACIAFFKGLGCIQQATTAEEAGAASEKASILVDDILNMQPVSAALCKTEQTILARRVRLLFAIFYGVYNNKLPFYVDIGSEEGGLLEPLEGQNDLLAIESLAYANLCHCLSKIRNDENIDPATQIIKRDTYFQKAKVTALSTFEQEVGVADLFGQAFNLEWVMYKYQAVLSAMVIAQSQTTQKMLKYDDMNLTVVSQSMFCFSALAKQVTILYNSLEDIQNIGNASKIINIGYHVARVCPGPGDVYFSLVLAWTGLSLAKHQAKSATYQGITSLSEILLPTAAFRLKDPAFAADIQRDHNFSNGFAWLRLFKAAYAELFAGLKLLNGQPKKFQNNLRIMRGPIGVPSCVLTLPLMRKTLDGVSGVKRVKGGCEQVCNCLHNNFSVLHGILQQYNNQCLGLLRTTQMKKQFEAHDKPIENLLVSQSLAHMLLGNTDQKNVVKGRSHTDAPQVPRKRTGSLHRFNSSDNLRYRNGDSSSSSNSSSSSSSSSSNSSSPREIQQDFVGGPDTVVMEKLVVGDYWGGQLKPAQRVSPQRMSPQRMSPP